ncbi:acyltransferase domain-containing protein [Allokutzneria oryzae]|uniref:Acyltransferase domain-containing protein n=1 Tax=Allokutzneria oryzae TaxID=1378989 RepID=A0ABV5ZXP2_9PSEU
MGLSNAAEIEAWIIARVAGLCGLDPVAVDAREPFTRHGMDSRGLTGLTGELAEELGRPVSATLVWTHPTPRALAERLAGGAPEHRAPDRAPPASVAGEPIAVVGLSCRLPGGRDPDEFWRLLSAGRDAVVDAPVDRGMTGRGGFLDRIDEFDAAFFDISPREAAHVDPQQRLALELAWEALENAGLPPRGLSSSRTGVFVGAMWGEYTAAPELLGQHSLAGTDPSVIPARISYALGLRGPSLQVNTACSSSLVAVHLAVQSLRDGDCDLALVGGVSLMLDPATTIALRRLGALAPDGRSKAFDARADGYGRGEGGGFVVLKPLSAALADGDPVLSVIRGSAVNNDGASNGLTAPNGLAQQEVLRAAYQRAGIAAADVQYVEAHGTGTELGDPIEASALSEVLCADRPADRPLRLGSVKANIGHLEAAAGMAGLIKVVLAMRHRALPPSVAFEHPNPHIPFEEWGLRVQRDLEEWTGDADGRLVAGVSAFGFGGTNCHLVLEGGQDRAMRLVTLAADTEDELRRRARELDFGQGTGRFRLALSVREDEDLGAGAEAFLSGTVRPGVAWGEVTGPPPRVVFAYGGQGSQWPGMAADLLREPVFRRALARCDEVVGPRVGRSLRTLLASREDDWLADTAVAQPAIFAMQVALTELARSRGIEPHAVVGASMGEVAAAHVAGALDLETAATLMCERSRVARGLSGSGAMAVLEMPVADVEAVLHGNEDRVWVAGVAGPRSTVISGDRVAVREVMDKVAARGIRCGAIRVDYASHSPYVEPILPEFRAALAAVRPQPCRIPFFSAVTGGLMPGELLDVEHWVRTERDPWRLSTAVEALLADGYTAFVDMDPHAVLLGPLEQAVSESGKDAVVLASARRGERGGTALVDALGSLYARGASLPVPRENRPELLVLSGRTEAALRESASAVAEWLVANENSALDDVCHTLGARRSHQEYRLSVTADSHTAMADALRTVPMRRSWAENAVFVFSGQGTQWVGMGRALLADEPAFRDAVSACDELFTPLAGWSLLDALTTSELTDTAVAQPLIFAIQVGLVDLLRQRGVSPAAVIGHSVGEVAAAYAAGVLSLADAVHVVFHRGRVMSRTAGLGGMVSVALPEEVARELPGVRAGHLDVAAVNDPGSVVLSGERQALATLGVPARELRVDHAFHSHQMDPVLDELARELREITPRPATIPLYSTVGGDRFDADHWVRNVRGTVRFADAVDAAIAAGYRLFVEIGPHPALSDNIEQCLVAQGQTGNAVGTLRRGHDDREAVSRALGELYTHGLHVDFGDGRLIDLPGYPWQRVRHWRPVGRGAVGHPLLGTRTSSSIDAGTHFWQRELNGSSYLGDLSVVGEKVLPAAAYMEMALSCRDETDTVTDMVFEQLLSFEGGSTPTTQVVLTGDSVVRVSSQQGDTWVRHAVAKLGASAEAVVPQDNPEVIVGRCATRISGVEHYLRLAEQGVEFGEGLRGVREIHLGDGEAVARVEAPFDEPGYRLHPVLLDSCLQVAAALSGAPVLVSVERLTLHRNGLTGGWAHAVSRVDSPLIDLRLLADDGEVLVEVMGLRLESMPDKDDRLHTVEWRRHEHHPAAAVGGTWLVLDDEDGIGKALAERLRANGADCVDSLDDLAAPPTGVVWPYDAHSDVLDLVNAISRRGWRDTPRLWLVTRDAQKDVMRPEQATVWGLGRTIALRHPEFDCTRLDITGDDVELLVRELAAASDETEVVLRPDGRYVARIVRVNNAVGRHGGLTSRPDATYLVVGVDKALIESGHVVTEYNGEPLKGILCTERAWELHELSLNHDLDFFVMLSSGASLLGDGGDAETGAFHDALARYRRNLGLPALSLGGDHAVVSGVLPTAPAQLTVVDLDVRQWTESHPGAAGAPLLSELPREAPRGGGEVREILLATAAQRRQIVLEDHIVEQLALTLHQEPSTVDRSTPFRSLGLESLMAVELRNRLEAGVGVRLSVALLFTYSTVTELAGYLLAEMDLEPAPPQEDEWSALAEDLDRMSDAEVEALLLESIRSVEEGPHP